MKLLMCFRVFYQVANMKSLRLEALKVNPDFGLQKIRTKEDPMNFVRSKQRLKISPGVGEKTRMEIGKKERKSRYYILWEILGLDLADY